MRSYGSARFCRSVLRCPGSFLSARDPGGTDWALRFERRATHPAKPEIRRIVFTTVRADHDCSPKCTCKQFNSPRPGPCIRPFVLESSRSVRHDNHAEKVGT